jgi:lipoprotein NlpI
LTLFFLVPPQAVAQEDAAADVAGRHPAFAACLDFDGAACDAVLAAEPGNLTARFMRGLASVLAGEDAAAFADFDQVATREPRHFGAQLWRHIAAASLRAPDRDGFSAYLAHAKLPPWPKVLGELYLGAAAPDKVVALAQAQPAPARAEALCAAHYHIGHAALLAGDAAAAMAAFRAALATGAAHVFEYRAALRDLDRKP